MNVARDEEIALLFTEARTHNAWLDQPVDDELLQRIYGLTKWGPTSANSQPLRIVFVKSKSTKEKLRPSINPGNLEKTMSAPVTAIMALDTEFFEKMLKLFPARPEMKDFIAGLPMEARDRMALISATLQAGYFILAARALGLDCGPMAGFDGEKLDADFFPDGKWKSIVLLNLGHGDASKAYPRNPRLNFDEACRID